MGRKKIRFSKEDMERIERSNLYPWVEEADEKKKKGLILWKLLMFFYLISPVIGFFISMNVFAMVCAVDTVIFFVVAIKNFQIDAMLQLTSYFEDENHNFFKVTITNGASSPGAFYYDDEESGMKTKHVQVFEDMETARNKSMVYYYVMRFKNQQKDWNMWTGGQAKVRALPHLELVSVGRKKDTYRYQMHGRTKYIKIHHAYAGLRNRV